MGCENETIQAISRRDAARGVAVLLMFYPAVFADQPLDLVGIANDFALEYMDWARAKQSELYNPGTVNARAAQQWDSVAKKFRALDRAVRMEASR